MDWKKGEIMPSKCVCGHLFENHIVKGRGGDLVRSGCQVCARTKSPLQVCKSYIPTDKRGTREEIFSELGLVAEVNSLRRRVESLEAEVRDIRDREKRRQGILPDLGRTG